MYEQITLIQEIFNTHDYDDRCALIEDHLDDIDEETVEAFELLTSRQELSPPERWVMANLCARTLSQVALVHARRGDIREADRFAEYSLESFQRAFYMPADLGLDDCEDMTTSHLNLLLAFAGDLRAHGLEDRAWQAYWIADPLFAAMSAGGTIIDIPVAQQLEAAYLLEQAGMPEKSRELISKARKQAGSSQQFSREKKLARQLFSVPSVLPEPDIYSGETPENAIRFTAQVVGVRCVQQTRCPRCHGPLKYVSKALVGSADKKVFDKYTLECTDNSRHPAVTLYKDCSKEPLMAQLAPKLGGLMEEAEREKKGKSVSSPGVSYPEEKEKRTYNLIFAFFMVLITGAASMLSSLVAWGLFRFFWEAGSYWQVLLGNIAGSISGVALFMVLVILFSLPRVLKSQAGEPSRLVKGVAGLSGAVVGGYLGYFIAGLAGLASLAFLLVIYLLMNLFGKR